MVFMKEFLKKLILNKKISRRQKTCKITKLAELNWLRCQSDCGYQSVSMRKLVCIIKVHIQCKTKDRLSHDLANIVVSTFQPQVNII